MMLSLFRSADRRTIAGQGPRILLFTFPAVLAALGLGTLGPAVATFPGSLGFLSPFGWLLLAPGVGLWLTGVVQLLVEFPRGRLVTTGAYGFCRNPIYSSFVWFLLPGLSLVTLTWVWLLPAAFLALGIHLNIGDEEGPLLATFGSAYEDYRGRVGRMTPRWRGWGTVVAWVRRRPIAAFLGLTLVWSWGFWSVLNLFLPPGGLMKDPPPVSFVFVLAGGLGPSLAGFLLTGVVDGRAGLGSLGRRLIRWKVGPWWAAILVIPALTALVPLLRAGLGVPTALSGLAASWFPALLIGLAAGLMEEIGWRGYLLPRLLQRWSPLRATLVVGLVWGGLWHGYADWFGLGDRGWAFLPLMLLLGPVLLTAWSLVQTRVAQRTGGSLLLALLVHASISSSAFALGQGYGSVEEEVVWTALQVGLDALGAGLFWVLTRKKKVPEDDTVFRDPLG